MSSAPSFQFYPSDFLGSGIVQSAEADEIGAYIILLSLDWNEVGFSYDEKKLARACRMSTRRFRVVWANLSHKFPERNGRRYNPRLDLQREEQARWREKSRRGGIASAAQRSKGGCQMVDTNGQPQANTPTPTPTPVTTTATTSAPAAAGKPKREPKPKAEPRPTWLTPARDAWEAKNGAGSFPFGRAAKALAGLLEAGHTPGRIGRHLYWYLHETDPRFAKLEHFAQTFAQHDPDELVEAG